MGFMNIHAYHDVVHICVRPSTIQCEELTDPHLLFYVRRVIFPEMSPMFSGFHCYHGCLLCSRDIPLRGMFACSQELP
jgi:hypothetical protein